MTDLRAIHPFLTPANPFLRSLGLVATVVVAAGCGGDGNADLGVDASTDMPQAGTDPTGTPCVDGTTCAGGVCLLGFERLGAEEFDGSLFPDGYCSAVECATDGDCGADGGCLARPGGQTSVCLTTCTQASDCRDGYTCASAPGNTDSRMFCQFEELERCTHNAAWEQADTCILRYQIAAGDAQFQITGTNLMLGDATFDVGPGEVVIRTTAADGNPTTGVAGVLCHDIRQNFRNEQGVITYTRGSAVSTTSATLASGTLDTSTNVLTWDACTYSDTYGVDVNSWTPADTASGPGCLAQYRSQGDVNCAAGSFICGVGNLQEGHNIQDGMWTQPLNGYEFGADLATLTMGGLNQPAEASVDDKVEIPNEAPSRTYLGFTATLVDTTCY